jgi:hypothetical protein
MVVVVVVRMYWITASRIFLKPSPFNSKNDLVAGCLVGLSSSTTKKESSKDLKHVMDSTKGFDENWLCMKK